jgi:hypothetical protein
MDSGRNSLTRDRDASLEGKVILPERGTHADMTFDIDPNTEKLVDSSCAIPFGDLSASAVATTKVLVRDTLAVRSGDARQSRAASSLAFWKASAVRPKPPLSCQGSNFPPTARRIIFAPESN